MQKGFAPILVLVGILVIIVVAGGAYYFKVRSEPVFTNGHNIICVLDTKQCPDGSFVKRAGPYCEFSPCSSTAPKTPNATPALTGVGETDNWKKYKDTEYNYSVKYPNDWTISIDKDHKVSLSPPGADIVANTPQDTPGSEIKPEVLIYFVDKPFVKPTEPASQLTTLNINGIDGYYYHMLGAPVSPWIFDLPFSNANGIIRFELISLYENIDIFNKKYGTNVKDADERTFKQILSTFKFTN